MLNSRQKKILRAKAHDLDPVVLIGRSGASNGCIQSIDEVIEVRELIKIKFIEHNISLEQDSLEFLLSKGLMTTPVTFVGDEFVVGYNITKLELMLNNIS